MIFKNRSIREKLLIACIIVTLVPMLVLELVSIVQANETAYEREVRDAEVVAERLIYNYTVEMEKAELVVDTLSEFTPLRTYLDSSFRTPAAARDYYKQNIYPLIAPHNNIKSGLRIRIYHNYPQKDSALEISESLDDFVRKNFTVNPFKSGISFWTSVDCYTFHPVISYFMPVVDSENYKNVGYVVSAHIKEDYLYSYIANEPLDERWMIVMDKSGNVLTSNDRSIVGKRFDDLFAVPERAEFEAGKPYIELEGKKYRAIQKSSDNLDLYVLLSDAKLQDQAFASIMKVVAVGILLMAISACLIFYITRKITADLTALAEKMSNVDRRSIHTMAKDTADNHSNDEIDRLDRAFTKMMRQIDELVEKVQDDERKLNAEVITRQQAELGYLQQQINPHYLFNTLESIRMNLVYKNDLENANIVKLFGESFRRYIDMKDEFSPLYEEITFLEKYISIQNYRLNNKIHYTCEESSAAMNVKIPKLLIQPVVENAVIHGFEDRPEGGSIRVAIRRCGAKLFITVTDDGAGMSEESLEALRAHIYSAGSEGSIGLRNVYRRLKLVYGEEASMEILSAEGKGTTVTMTIPEAIGGKDVSGSAG